MQYGGMQIGNLLPSDLELSLEHYKNVKILTLGSVYLLFLNLPLPGTGG
jgi:hypothetical protein